MEYLDLLITVVPSGLSLLAYLLLFYFILTLILSILTNIMYESYANMKKKHHKIELLFSLEVIIWRCIQNNSTSGLCSEKILRWLRNSIEITGIWTAIVRERSKMMLCALLILINYFCHNYSKCNHSSLLLRSNLSFSRELWADGCWHVWNTWW